MNDGWIGVDFDGTLAEYHGWKGEDHLGAPIPLMVERVKMWLSAGVKVKIITARVSYALERGPDSGVLSTRAFVSNQEQNIRAWCLAHLGQELEITSVKDFHMIELWDDRCICVQKNTGKAIKWAPSGSNSINIL